MARIDCAVHLTNGERKPEQLNNMLEIKEKFIGVKPDTRSLYLGTQTLPSFLIHSFILWVLNTDTEV